MHNVTDVIAFVERLLRPHNYKNARVPSIIQSVLILVLCSFNSIF